MAFSGPLNVTDRYGSFTPDDYVPIFKRMGVSLVVRLNKPQYEKAKFTKQGIDDIVEEQTHVDVGTRLPNKAR